jgi:hypothetical protein
MKTVLAGDARFDGGRLLLGSAPAATDVDAATASST